MAAAGSGTKPFLAIGVDGGGTKTKIVVFNAAQLPAPAADAKGDAKAGPAWTVAEVKSRVLAEVTVGGTNQNSVGAEAAAKNLQTGLLNALAAAKASGAKDADASHVRSVCLAMSGCDRPSDIALIQQWIKHVMPSASVAVYNDSVGALAGATFGRLYGMVLIAGTGMIAMGYDGKSEEPQRAGGWGSFVDDGSGYAIGCAVVKAAVHSQDLIGPKTALEQAVLKHLSLADFDALLGWIYSDPTNLGWAKFAALAPLAFEHAAAGDAVAKAIVASSAAALAKCLTTLAAKLKFTNEKVPVVFNGGVIENSVMGDAVWANVVKALPNAVRLLPSVDAAVGAAILAASK